MTRSYCLFIFFLVSAVHCLVAQGADENYEMLRTEIELYAAYQPLPKGVYALIDSANHYARQGDYDFAMVFLEQAHDDLSATSTKKAPIEPAVTLPDFQYYVQSGVDFNRQEFELGFDQSDSTLLDQVNKPFIGLGVRLSGFDGAFLLDNQLRFDKEYLENQINLYNHWSGDTWDINGSSGYVFDRNFVTNALGYHEIFSRWALNFRGTSSNFALTEEARYKRYYEPTTEIPDYFRNVLSAYYSYNINYYHDFSLNYSLDYNNSFRTSNNDYLNHTAGLEYGALLFSRLKLLFPVSAAARNFTYILSDSLLENNAVTVSTKPELMYRASDFISLGFTYQLDIKNYKIKTEQDPDYNYTRLDPQVRFTFADVFRIAIGYLDEQKKHVLQKDLEPIYIQEQNYRGHGVSVNMDYTRLSGLLLSLDINYTLRRYPDAILADNFSIYSNRNIISILAFAQWPINRHLSLSLIAAYDNDKDIDSEFNDSRSSYYTTDLKYEF